MEPVFPSAPPQSCILRRWSYRRRGDERRRGHQGTAPGWSDGSSLSFFVLISASPNVSFCLGTDRYVVWQTSEPYDPVNPGSFNAIWAVCIEQTGNQKPHKLLAFDTNTMGLGTEAGFFSPGQRLLAVPAGATDVHVFEAATLKPLFVQHGTPYRIDWVAIDDGATHMATVSSENFRDGDELRVWNSEQVRPFREIWGLDATSITIDWLRVRLELRKANASATSDWILSWVDSHGVVAQSVHIPWEPASFSLSSDERTACLTDSTGSIYLWHQGTDLHKLALPLLWGRTTYLIRRR